MRDWYDMQESGQKKFEFELPRNYMVVSSHIATPPQCCKNWKKVQFQSYSNPSPNMILVASII